MARSSKFSVGLLFALILYSPLLNAQQSSIDDLRDEIRRLNETVKSMQRDLQEIKALLSGRAPASPPQKVLLDLGNSPTRGEPSASLTLVEFSDYQ